MRDGFRPQRDSRLGKQFVIDRTVSAGRALNATAAARNAARPTPLIQRISRPERAMGTTGLKSTAIARNATAREAFPARRACAPPRRLEAQTTIANNTGDLATGSSST